jgi:DNA uptake protein ComE-like DNA-binding protein
MKNGEFQRLIRDYFSFTRSERRGLVVLVSILMFSIVLYFFADKFNFTKPISETEKKKFLEWAKQKEHPIAEEKLRFFSFNPNTIAEEELDSLGIPSEIKNNLIRYRNKGGAFSRPEDFRKLYGMTDTIFSRLLPYITIPSGKSSISLTLSSDPGTKVFMFDPNKVSENELTKLGFSTYQKNNLLKYRKSGARFEKKTDLLKVYGIDSAFYYKIADYLMLGENPYASSEQQEVILIELNQADSASLVKLRGIGAYFAGRIIRYRNILGGYCSIRQLMEVYGMSEEKFTQFQQQVYADSTLIRPVRLNFADEKSLDRHPYISRLQATQIIDLREAQGAFQNCGELLDKGIFDKTSYERVKPYITCR